MAVSDLFAASRRILHRLFGRSRRVALAAALVPLGAIGMSSAEAAPTIELPPEFPITPFSIRVTDMERIVDDPEQDAFRVELEVLNWARYGAHSFSMATNTGSSAIDGQRPTILGASVDPDGRGGAPGGSDIGAGVYDPVAIHHGRGRGDVSDRLNDWLVASETPSYAHWVSFDTANPMPYEFGNSIPYRDLLSTNTNLFSVPGFGTDDLGDSAIDGGPEPYSPSSPGGGPNSFMRGNVLDGLVIDIDDWDVGEVFSVNWFLAGVLDTSASYHPVDNPLRLLFGSDGQSFAFGVMSLVRIEPSIGSPAGDLPGAVFEGNTGFDQSAYSFYDTVYEIPNPAEFAAEFGAAITAPFLNPADNVFSAPVNTRLIVPEPSSVLLVGAGLLGSSGLLRKRRL